MNQYALNISGLYIKKIE